MRLTLLFALLACCAPAALAQGSGTGNSPYAVFEDSEVLDALRGFHPWLSASGTYVHQLDQAAVNRPDSVMGQVAGGVGGGKVWKDSLLGLSVFVGGTYSGRAILGGEHWREHYTGALSYMRQVNKRIQVGASLSGGSSFGGYGAGSAFGLSMIPGMTSTYGLGSLSSGFSSLSETFQDPGQNGLVDNELFLRPAAFFSAGGNLSYTFTERTYVNFSSGTGFVWRDGGLAGLGMFTGGASLGHRVSQRIEFGTTYMTSRFKYPNTFGGVTSQQAGGGMTVRISQRTKASLMGGYGWVDSNFIGSVALDPEAASLLGTGTQLAVQKAHFGTMLASGLLTHSVFHGGITVSARRLVSPGNGLMLTSIRDMASLAYGTPLGRKAGISISSYLSKNSGRVGTLGIVYTAQGGVGYSYRLFNNISLTCGAGVRAFWLPGTPRTSSLYATVGLAWSPGDRPFRF